MIRAILAILALSLMPDGALAGKKPKFKPVPGASSSEKAAPVRRDSKRFRSAPAPKAEGGPVKHDWLPERPAEARLPFEWYDALSRCLTSVARTEPIDDAGMVTVGDRLIDYDQPYTRQTWQDATRTVTVNYEIEAGFGNTPSRLCKVEDVRGKGASAESAQAIDDGFVDWAYDLIGSGQYVSRKHPERGKVQAGDVRYALLSKAGNSRKCKVRIRFAKTFFGNKAQVVISISEAAKKPCHEKRGNVGGV